MPSLADIPFLSGYTQQNAINQQQGAQQLQQVGLLAQLQQRMQAQQEEATQRQQITQYAAQLPTGEREAFMLNPKGFLDEKFKKRPLQQRDLGDKIIDVDPMTGAQVGEARPKGLAPQAPEKPLPLFQYQSQRQKLIAGGMPPDHPIIKGIDGAIAKLTTETPKAPTSRTRIDGEVLINEEFQPDGTWKETGSGPRFARQVPPAVLPGAQLPKPKSGYQWNADGSEQVFIKGGPEWNKQSMAMTKDRRAVEGINSQIADTVKVIDDILTHKGLSVGTGMTGVVARQVPGTEARNFDRLLETLNAKISFDALAKMRRESPTGGALGQITVRELELLSQSIRAIDPTQSPEDFKKNLAEIKNILNTSKERISGTFQEQYRDILGGSAPAAAPSGAAGGWTVKEKK